MRYYQNDNKQPEQGLLKLDSNEIFNVDPKVVQLTKIDVIPSWMSSVWINGYDYLLADCQDVD